MLTKTKQEQSSEKPWTMLTGEERRQRRLKQMRETGAWTVTPEEAEMLAERSRRFQERLINGLRSLDPNNMPETP